MNIPKIIEAIGGIDDKYLKEAELPERRRFRFKPTLLAAIIAIIALSTSVSALSYNDYTIVQDKTAKNSESSIDRQKTDNAAEAVPLSAKKKAVKKEIPVPVNYISYTSGTQNLKYTLDRRSGFAYVSPFDEEKTHPGFADLTITCKSTGDYDFFYREYGEAIPNPEEFPWLESLDGYVNELTPEGEFMTGDLRVTSVMCDEHFFFATVQYALPEKVKKALEDLPEGAELCFNQCRVEPSGPYMWSTPIFIDGDVMTFLVCAKCCYSFTGDEASIDLRNFGYDDPNNNYRFTSIYNSGKTVTIPMEGIKKAENRISKSVVCSTELGDVTMTAELSPFGIILKMISDNPETTSAFCSSKYFGDNIRIHLDDGRIYGSGKSYFGTYYLFDGKSGFSENCEDDDPANDIQCLCLPFVKPVDIEKVEKLSIDGYELVFED